MLRLAFYKARYDGIRGFAINNLTGRYGYSHVELVFPDGQSFSSSPRDGGVRFKEINFDLDKWVFVDYPLSPYEEKVVRKRAEYLAETKAGYDWAGIFLFHLLPFHAQDADKYWCDEAINHVLGRRPERTSPNELARQLGVPGCKR